MLGNEQNELLIGKYTAGEVVPLFKARGFKDKHIKFTNEITEDALEKLFIAILIQALQDLVKNDSELTPAENEINRYYSTLYFSTDCELYKETCRLFDFDPDILIEIASGPKDRICGIIKRMRKILDEL